VQIAWASPFGQGVFGAQVPFGSQTAISIALGGNVNLSLVPNGSNFSASGSSSVTVTSTDVDGYNLYVYSPSSTSLINGGNSIPASSNVSAAALSVNSWGYNTDGSSNFVGLTSTPTVITTTTGPYENGNTTNVTYGVLAASTTPSGTYSGNTTFTVVASNK
jgi:hypothetical protein